MAAEPPLWQCECHKVPPLMVAEPLQWSVLPHPFRLLPEMMRDTLPPAVAERGSADPGALAEERILWVEKVFLGRPGEGQAVCQRWEATCARTLLHPEPPNASLSLLGLPPGTVQYIVGAGLRRHIGNRGAYKGVGKNIFPSLSQASCLPHHHHSIQHCWFDVPGCCTGGRKDRIGLFVSLRSLGKVRYLKYFVTLTISFAYSVSDTTKKAGRRNVNNLRRIWWNLKKQMKYVS